MADDRMKNDDVRNMGQGGGEGQNWDQGQGQQTPGRNPQTGQEGASKQHQQGAGKQGQPGYGQQGSDLDNDAQFGGTGQGNIKNRGGQNR
jgi:hypothetical protein